jgi:hypothetical protein
MKIDIKDNLADLLTKSLTQKKFTYNLADLLTKSLTQKKFTYLVGMISYSMAIPTVWLIK